MKNNLNIVVLGLSITSSWGNGHATTFRGLIRELHKNGHDVTFLERDVPWYASNRDLKDFSYCNTILYSGLDELRQKHTEIIRFADLVIVGSYVPEGVAVGHFVVETADGITAFYDIDTPVTLAKMEKNDFEYLHPDLIPMYHMYLSFTGGPTLKRLEEQYGSPMARPFYCSFDPELYFPEEQVKQWDLGYLGTYSTDRQPPLTKLMLQAAEEFQGGRFVVAGPQYPAGIEWPSNVERIEHLPPLEHRKFYNSQRFTMNITRDDMIRAGYSPSVRLFEAAACNTPIISDYWEGIESIFEPGKEILISKSAEETVNYLTGIGEEERQQIAASAREKVLAYHTAAHRAKELETYYSEATAFSRTVQE
ncbi:CgeB family protein [Dyadobacter sediminis]|uniref:Glycosyltransferase n=1 Tax=Dyadobacter sediminis TaxID=1493691 RepID=A0A5R9KJ66_9BACT|nr:glycosyltransferase [Dyadobacter sediminis]TLU96126.1 glycosyltransferase [Dyadobacter sediminis]GGB79480.1 glycosyl transferase [Dyadobacter sediminis]